MGLLKVKYITVVQNIWECVMQYPEEDARQFVEMNNHDELNQ